MPPFRVLPLLLAALALGCPKPTEPTEAPDEAATPSDPIEHAHQLMQQGQPAQAQAVVEQALQGKPEDPELWFSKGVAQRAQGDTAGAVTSWEQALTLDPEQVAARHGLAALRLEAGDHEGAVAAYVEILQLEPDFKDAHYNLALALLALDRKAEARGALENAHRLDPQDADVALELGRLLALEGKLGEAIDVVGPVADKATGDAEVLSTYAWLLDRARRSEQAAAAFEALLALQPEDDDARLGLARAYMRIGKEAQAVTELQALASRRPDDAAVWLSWGTALGKLGDLDGAVAKLDQALALQPDLQTAHVQKIGTLVLAGRCKEAKAAKKALDRHGPTDHATRAVKAALGPCR